MHSDTKLTFQRALNAMAVGRAAEAIQRTGSALPCRVDKLNPPELGYSWVTVCFEVLPSSQGGPWTLPRITIPKLESQWLRAPTQVGDFGLTVPADTALWGVSGSDPGFKPNETTDYGNLGTLAFMPVGSALFGAMPDPNKAWVNGPNGAVLGSTDQTFQITVDETAGTVTILCGSQTIVISNDPSMSFEGSAGLIIGLGALASSLASTRAGVVNADLTTLANNLIATTVQTFSAALGAAAITAAIPNAAAFSAIISAANWVKNLSGINPTIPSGSSIVRIAS